MLVQQGAARTSRIDRRLAGTLAAIAGAVNVAAFQAVGFFAANMTGNVSSASDRAAFGQIRQAAFLLAIVGTFIFGAAVSSLIIAIGRRRDIRGVYALSILAEAVLMAALSLTGPLLWPLWRGPVLVLGLSFLMGLQNAVVTRISNARVRTTHISGMATDIGIGLGLLLDMACGGERRAERETVLANLRLHGMTVLCFLAGGLAGGLVYRQVGIKLLLGCAALLLLIAVPQAVKAKSTGLTPAEMEPTNLP
jgi:uncharacterized membrane protein YoaK (UPF0700 family)